MRFAGGANTLYFLFFLRYNGTMTFIGVNDDGSVCGVKKLTNPQDVPQTVPQTVPQDNSLDAWIELQIRKINC